MRIIQHKTKIQEYWSAWYAWHPVQCELANGEYAWVMLEQVERKQTYGYGGTQWRYREALREK